MTKNTKVQIISMSLFSFMASGTEHLDLDDLDLLPFKRSDRENSAFLDFDLQNRRVLDNLNYSKSNELKDTICRKIILSGLKSYSTKEGQEVIEILNRAMLFRHQSVRILGIPLNYENFMEELTRQLTRITDISNWNPLEIFTCAYHYYKNRKLEPKIVEKDTFQQYPSMKYHYKFYGTYK